MYLLSPIKLVILYKQYRRKFPHQYIKRGGVNNMRYNFQTSQEEVLHFLYLRIEELTKENKQLKQKLDGKERQKICICARL